MKHYEINNHQARVDPESNDKQLKYQGNFLDWGAISYIVRLACKLKALIYGAKPKFLLVAPRPVSHKYSALSAQPPSHEGINTFDLIGKYYV